MDINREPLPFWEHRGSWISVDTPGGPYSDMLGKRALDSFSEFQRQMNVYLYGDDVPAKPITYWQRFKNWFGDNRITNAWLVLIGREDIDRGYY